MKYRQDNDAAILCAEINAVRKMSGEDSPNVPADNGKLERVFRCQRHATVNFGHELKGKANSLRLIPRTCLDELRTGGTMKSDGQAHCLILARAAAFTSLQGTTSSGLARWSARRRSSSFACASVNAGAAPRPTIPSQMASTSSICSSMSSTRACCKSCVFMIWTPFKTGVLIPARWRQHAESYLTTPTLRPPSPTFQKGASLRDKPQQRSAVLPLKPREMLPARIRYTLCGGMKTLRCSME